MDKENNELRLQIACACDLLNSWARDHGVEECQNPYENLELRNLVERLWNYVSIHTIRR